MPVTNRGKRMTTSWCCREEAASHLVPVEPLHVEIGESEPLLSAGTISSILEGTIVVQVLLEH